MKFTEQGWVIATIEGRKVQAKVYDEPSMYGINGGRISKLHVSKEGRTGRGLRNACYNYDRGLDIDDGDPVVANIISVLEKLPSIEERMKS